MAYMIRSLVLALIVFCGLLSVTLAQDSESNIDCSKAAAMKRPVRFRSISAGVLNGKAIVLPKPIYPQVARAVGARGTVSVSILIDPRGCVNEARTNFGHPLLISAALDAALRTQFSPTTLSDNPVWVNGIITYNFVGDDQNWLEIGFHIERWHDFSGLPTEFQSKRDLLVAIRQNGIDTRAITREQVYSQIDELLAQEPKKQWLYRVGRLFGRIDNNEFRSAIGTKTRSAELTKLIEKAPSEGSTILVEHLKQLAERTDIYLDISNIKLKMYALGR